MSHVWGGLATRGRLAIGLFAGAFFNRAIRRSAPVFVSTVIFFHKLNTLPAFQYWS